MTMHSKFPGICKTCGGTFAAGERIDWQRGVGARHETAADCEAATVETLLRTRATALRAAAAKHARRP